METFFDVAPDPTLAAQKKGAEQLSAFKPDMDMAMRFKIDNKKSLRNFPRMGEKAYFIAVPTSAGTGSEVTPFAVGANSVKL